MRCKRSTCRPPLPAEQTCPLSSPAARAATVLYPTMQLQRSRLSVHPEGAQVNEIVSVVAGGFDMHAVVCPGREVPDHPKALWRRATVRAFLGQLDDAEEDFR